MIPRRIIAQSVFFKSSWRNAMDVIRERWDQDYYITDFDYGDGGYFIVMSQVRGWNGQCVKYGSEFPRDDVRELWKKGYAITNMLHDGTDWIVVLTKVSYCKSQGYFSSMDWSEFRADVRKSWRSDMVATKLACDIQPHYTQYMAAVTEFEDCSPSQGMHCLSGSVTADELGSLCSEDEFIADMYDFDGCLCVITSNERKMRGVAIKMSYSLDEIFDAIEQYVDNGFKITTVCYYRREWIVVFAA